MQNMIDLIEAMDELFQQNLEIVGKIKILYQQNVEKVLQKETCNNNRDSMRLSYTKQIVHIMYSNENTIVKRKKNRSIKSFITNCEE